MAQRTTDSHHGLQLESALGKHIKHSAVRVSKANGSSLDSTTISRIEDWANQLQHKNIH
jgi:hypothetical protein